MPLTRPPQFRHAARCCIAKRRLPPARLFQTLFIAAVACLWCAARWWAARRTRETDGMWIRACVAVALGTVLIGTTADAQQAPLRRYKPVVISYDVKGADDADLAAFIASLTAAVARRDVASLRKAASPDLAVFTPPYGFPPASPPKPRGFEAGLDGPRRFDSAMALLAADAAEPDRKALDRLTLMAVSEALAAGTIGRSALAGGRLCAPAEPKFNRSAVLAIAAAAGEVPENLVILTADSQFLERPDASSPVAGSLKAGSVVPFVEGAVEGADGQRDWYAVGLPAGKRGFAKGDRSLSFETTRFCFGTSAEGWAITAVIVPTTQPSGQ
ncbi:SH3 domain-containing protein [Ancylobacter terrae]|uniref:hypothetical protein n=1 Tax=Ancylobacter sp. sgz301288 TaxID=3342077 RepID=UPI0038598E10